MSRVTTERAREMLAAEAHPCPRQQSGRCGWCETCCASLDADDDLRGASRLLAADLIDARSESDAHRTRADAAEARHAALAGAVRAAREAESALSEALAATNRTPTRPGERIERYEAFCAAERVYVAAHERTDALLRGAPGGYVPVGAVREYLAALDVLPGDLATINAAIDRERTARTALDAALLAATTTPTEGHRP